MSRFRLRSLDEARLTAFAERLRGALAREDRDALAALAEASELVAAWPRPLVELYLVAPSHPASAELRAALRAGALSAAGGPEVSLQSKVVDDLVRNLAGDAAEPLAGTLLALVDETRAPFFVRAPDVTLGFVSAAQRGLLASELAAVEIGPLDELRDGLAELRHAVLLERG